MQIIDAHQHFWIYDPVRDAWITDEMSVIQKDFLPEHLFPVLQENGIHGTVAVQADQSEEENRFLLIQADRYDFIKGVIGWVNLQDENVEEKLQYYSRFEKMKGFRHVLQGEADRGLMLKPAFKHGIGLLKKYSFTYDILIFPDQIKYATQLVKEFPDQKFVIDHIAKPHIRDKEIDQWKEEIYLLAAHPNVTAKISGMVTEADWKHWSKDELIPYIDVVVHAFGMKRIMFGSDWPVCLVAASYNQWLNILTEYFSSFSLEEQDNFFGNNAIAFYNL